MALRSKLTLKESKKINKIYENDAYVQYFFEKQSNSQKQLFQTLTRKVKEQQMHSLHNNF